jgi:hypothetical protein
VVDGLCINSVQYEFDERRNGDENTDDDVICGPRRAASLNADERNAGRWPARWPLINLLGSPIAFSSCSHRLSVESISRSTAQGIRQSSPASPELNPSDGCGLHSRDRSTDIVAPNAGLTKTLFRNDAYRHPRYTHGKKVNV